MTVILIDILAIKNAQKNIQEIVIRSPFFKKYICFKFITVI